MCQTRYAPGDRFAFTGVIEFAAVNEHDTGIRRSVCGTICFSGFLVSTGIYKIFREETSLSALTALALKHFFIILLEIIRSIQERSFKIFDLDMNGILVYK